jgi:hypothetical protein
MTGPCVRAYIVARGVRFGYMLMTKWSKKKFDKAKDGATMGTIAARVLL